MRTLADIVTVERRFARSARLDADLGGTPPLTGYVLQGSVQKSLLAMMAGIAEGGQTAFTWTGPYGGGKSSAALLLLGSWFLASRHSSSMHGTPAIGVSAISWGLTGSGWSRRGRRTAMAVRYGRWELAHGTAATRQGRYGRPSFLAKL